MKLYGVEITQAQITAGLLVMITQWTCKDVEKALLSAGVPRSVHQKAADRLLRKEKAAGRIIFDKKFKHWMWNPEHNQE